VYQLVHVPPEKLSISFKAEQPETRSVCERTFSIAIDPVDPLARGIQEQPEQLGGRILLGGAFRYSRERAEHGIGLVPIRDPADQSDHRDGSAVSPVACELNLLDTVLVPDTRQECSMSVGLHKDVINIPADDLLKRHLQH
jgi:hypothetical protein